MEGKTKKIDKENEVYEKLEESRKKYLELMAEDEVNNAVKFNKNLNEKMAKLGLKTCTYTPKENDDEQD